MRQHYKHQPIVATDWPPRIGKDFFGRLALVEKQDSSTQAETAWHMLRGQVDKTVKLTGNKEISVEDVLQPTDSSLSLRVVIDGPPGIGKTTLCRKLLNMWSNGTLAHQHYDLVLCCPLRNSKIATATTLADLFLCQRYEVPMVTEWFAKGNGKGLLIIFDGWDELSEQLRQSSLATSIFYRKQLDQCSVIVTSRSYASSSLLKMDTLSRHVQVIGFSEEEISTVIIQTLQSKDSQLAVKLINDLEVRNDVQSLCYVPLVCSMVILVYCKEGGHLPTTLTQLYENFILQTIRRHVEIKPRHGIDPYDLYSLSSLPSQLAKPLQEMCQLAYTNLTNTTMTFFSYQLQSLNEAVKEDYLGLITTFIEYDKKMHQFLHLSIQEFLAAWWIANHEKKTEEVFMDHFNDDHFRLCLRFVAGLTHLKHESYRQYFNKQQLDLQCKRKPLFGFENCYLSYFYHNHEIYLHSDNIYNVPILLLQLLYESQNTTLCRILAQSINNHSLCLDRLLFSFFDWLCLSYCINNSNTTWNHFHLRNISYKELIVLITGLSGLSSNSLQQTQCKRLEVGLQSLLKTPYEIIHQLLQTTFLYNIQECYFRLSSNQYVPCLVLLQFFSLPKMKILHLMINCSIFPTVDNTHYTDKCTELEKCIEMNSTLQEMKIEYYQRNQITNTIVSIIRGVTKNKTLTSLSMLVSFLNIENDTPPPPLPDGIIEQLLKDNNTIQALSLDIPDEILPPSLNIIEVNTPLTALSTIEAKLMPLLFPHIRGLHCLILPDPYLVSHGQSQHKTNPYPPHFIFLSHPSLQTLQLSIDTAESAIELFTILQTNTTLKALRVKIAERVYTSDMVISSSSGYDLGMLMQDLLKALNVVTVSNSIQDMLAKNRTLKCLEIINDIYSNISSSFLSFLTTGFGHNTSLQQLSVSIPLNNDIKTFMNVISQKNKLMKLKVHFKLDQLYCNCSEEEKIQIMTLLFYEHLLPAVTNMLQSHATFRILCITCDYINGKSFLPNWIELVQHLYETIFIHPSLEYVEFTSKYLNGFLFDILNNQEMLIDKKEQPHKPLPFIKICMNSSIR